MRKAKESQEAGSRGGGSFAFLEEPVDAGEGPSSPLLETLATLQGDVLSTVQGAGGGEDQGGAEREGEGAEEQAASAEGTQGEPKATEVPVQASNAKHMKYIAKIRDLQMQAPPPRWL